MNKKLSSCKRIIRIFIYRIEKIKVNDNWEFLYLNFKTAIFIFFYYQDYIESYF